MHLREHSRELPVPKTARLLMRACFLCARPGDTVIFVRTYLGITPNILLTQNIPRLPAGARLPTVFLSSLRKRSISRGDLSSFFLKRRKKDAEKKIDYNLHYISVLNQLILQFQHTAKSKFEIINLYSSYTNQLFRVRGTRRPNFKLIYNLHEF